MSAFGMDTIVGWWFESTAEQKQGVCVVLVMCLVLFAGYRLGIAKASRDAAIQQMQQQQNQQPIVITQRR